MAGRFVLTSDAARLCHSLLLFGLSIVCQTVRGRMDTNDTANVYFLAEMDLVCDCRVCLLIT